MEKEKKRVWLEILLRNTLWGIAITALLIYVTFLIMYYDNYFSIQKILTNMQIIDMVAREDDWGHRPLANSLVERNYYFTQMDDCMKADRTHYQSYGYVIREDTGEVLFDNRPKAYLFLSPQKIPELKTRMEEGGLYFGEKYRVFQCSIDYFPEIAQAMLECRHEWETGDAPTDRFFLSAEDVYVCLEDFSFLPGKIEITGYRINRDGTTTTFSPRQIDLTPQDTSGYLHIEELITINSSDDVMILGSAGWSDSVSSRAVNYFSSMDFRGDERRMIGDILKPWFPFNETLAFSFRKTFTDSEGVSFTAYYYGEYQNLFLDSLEYYVKVGIFYLVMMLAAVIGFTFWGFRKYRQTLVMNQYRRTLIDSMAHDLKTPLMTMSGYAENLKENLNTQKREYYAQEILKTIDYMNEIIGRDLELSRMERLGRKLKKEPVDLVEMCRELWKHYDEPARKKQLQITFQGEFRVKGDVELLERAMDNLLTNSLRYTPEGGSISVTGSTHKFRVCNQSLWEYRGSLKQMWEPFVRGDDSRDASKGTGLGLSIVDAILIRHRWSHKLIYHKKKRIFECRIFIL